MCFSQFEVAIAEGTVQQQRWGKRGEGGPLCNSCWKELTRFEKTIKKQNVIELAMDICAIH